MKGEDVRGLQREVPDLSWAGPAGQRMRELLSEVPRGCSVSGSPNRDAVVISFPSHETGCVSDVFAIVIVLGWVFALVFVPLACEVMPGLLKAAMPLCGGVALVGAGAVLWRLSGLGRQVVTLDSEVAILELRDWPTRNRLVPRNAIKQVRAWPEPSLLVRHPLARGLALRADRDYVVTCAIPRKSILWLGRLLSAWSGAEFIEHTRKE